MPTIKPAVDELALRELLTGQFGTSVSGLRIHEGGLVARTFTFSVRGQGYVIRFNHDNMDANFEKEEYIARTYSSPSVPIPHVVRIGRLQQLHYCITQRARGQRLDRLAPEEIVQAIPSVVATLSAIHKTDVSYQQGYGLFDGHGRGFFSSWPASLACVRDEERPDGFFGKWHRLFETSFLEREVFDRIHRYMEGLLTYCPDDRHLVHGGYGFGNLLVDGKRVTAVFDWLDAKYGDFLYDVAWLDYYDPARGYGQLFRQHYAEHDVQVPDFDRRLVCYQCYIALDGMRFFAKSDNADDYRWTRNRILDLIASQTGPPNQ